MLGSSFLFLLLTFPLIWRRKACAATEDTHQLYYGIRALPLKSFVARSVFFLFRLNDLFLYLLLFLSFRLVKWRKNEQQGRLRRNPLQIAISIFIMERTQQLHWSRQFSTRRTTIYGAGLS